MASLTHAVPQEWLVPVCRRPAPSSPDPRTAHGTEPLGKALGVQCHSSAPGPEYYCGTEHWCTCVYIYISNINKAFKEHTMRLKGIDWIIKRS